MLTDEGARLLADALDRYTAALREQTELDEAKEARHAEQQAARLEQEAAKLRLAQEKEARLMGKGGRRRERYDDPERGFA